MSVPRKRIAAVSFKSYFSVERTFDYCLALRDLLGQLASEVDAAVFPSYLAIPGVVGRLAGSGIAVGAQDISPEPHGAFTGEVPGADLVETGCSLVEIGHAERRRYFGDTEPVIAAKVAAALRANLTPLICIGETDRVSPSEAVSLCLRQVRGVVENTTREIWLGYEPHWAIGASHPASPDYVSEVCTEIATRLLADYPQVRVLYGGSAGPGLATQLGASVDGLFLGRFAHDPTKFVEIVEELLAST